MNHSTTLDLSYQRIIAIATPVLVANLAMPLQGAIDVAVVGHFPNTFSLAGLGIASQLWLLVLVSFNFLQYASSGLSAQALGRQSTHGTFNNDLVEILYRSLGLAVILGGLLFLFKSAIIHCGLALLDAAPASRQAATTYLSVRYYGILFELMNYVFIGWFAGQGKTKQMMVVQILISVVNIVLTLLFVYQFNLGLPGVALGTVLSYASGFLAASYIAYRSVIVARLNAYSQKISRNTVSSRDKFKNIYALKKMQQLFSLNKDIFIRTLLLTLSFTWITRMSAQQGDLVMATNALLLQVLSISAFALDGVAVAAESLSGQAIARQKSDLFTLVIKRTGLIAFGLAMALTIVWVLVLPSFLTMMTDLPDVYALAFEYRYIAALLPLIGAGAYWLDGIMFGLTAGARIRQVAVIVAALFFPLTWLLYDHFSEHYAMPVIWLSVYLLLLTRFAVAAIVLWRNKSNL